MATFGKSPQPPIADAGPASGATVIARETTFAGEVSGSRPVRVEGSIKGKVDLKAAFEVAAGATVEAEVHATTVRVAGRVVGNVTASEMVELGASAVVEGDVTTPALRVTEGARLDGRVTMKSSPASPAKAH